MCQSALPYTLIGTCFNHRTGSWEKYQAVILPDWRCYMSLVFMISVHLELIPAWTQPNVVAFSFNFEYRYPGIGFLNWMPEQKGTTKNIFLRKLSSIKGKSKLLPPLFRKPGPNYLSFIKPSKLWTCATHTGMPKMISKIQGECKWLSIVCLWLILMWFCLWGVYKCQVSHAASSTGTNKCIYLFLE